MSLYRATSDLNASIRAFTTDAESLKTHDPYVMACPWVSVDPAGRDEHRTEAGRSEGGEGSPRAVQAKRARRWAWGSGMGQRCGSSEPGPALGLGGVCTGPGACWFPLPPAGISSFHTTTSTPGRGHPQRHERLGVRISLDQGWVRVLTTKQWDGHCHALLI